MSAWIYAAIAAALLAAGFAVGDHWGAAGPEKDLATLKAQDWQGKAQAATVALGATQKQLKDLQDTDSRNAGIIQGLKDENTKTAADRDRNAELYQRLFNRPARPASPGGPQVPASPSGQGPPGTGGTASGPEAAGLLADARAECGRNADRLDALSAEISPQLKVTP